MGRYLSEYAFRNLIVTTGYRTTLKDGHLLPIPLIYEKIYPEEVFSDLRVGGKYILQAETCEDIEMPISVYECKHILKEFGGLTINSVVMKQIDGERGMIFSLTRSDCKNIGIEYEPQLELLPMGFNWKPLKEEVKTSFDPTNMGTYAPSPKDGTYHQMHVVIKGVAPFDSFDIITPDNQIMVAQQFLDTLQFRFRDFSLQRRFPITYKILYSDDTKHSIFDEKHEGIGFMLFFSAAEGINPNVFNNKTIDELIEVSWVSCNTKKPKFVNGSTLEKDREFKDWYNNYLSNNHFGSPLEIYPPL